MDLADGGVLGEQEPVATTQVGHVAQQHEHADDLVGLELWDRLHEQ